MKTTYKRCQSAQQIFSIMTDAYEAYQLRKFQPTDLFVSICNRHGLRNPSEQSKLKRSLIAIGFFEEEHRQSIKLRKKINFIDEFLLYAYQALDHRSKTHTARTYKSIEKKKDKQRKDDQEELLAVTEVKSMYLNELDRLNKREAELNKKLSN